MANKLAKFFIGIFGGITSVWWGKYLVMFIISLMPILELRGGLIAASLMDAPMLPSFLVCFLGNIIPIPFILWFITSIFDYLKKRGKKLGKLVLKLENKANSKKEQIEKLKSDRSKEIFNSLKRIARKILRFMSCAYSFLQFRQLFEQTHLIHSN